MYSSSMSYSHVITTKTRRMPNSDSTAQIHPFWFIVLSAWKQTQLCNYHHSIKRFITPHKFLLCPCRNSSLLPPTSNEDMFPIYIFSQNIILKIIIEAQSLLNLVFPLSIMNVKAFSSNLSVMVVCGNSCLTLVLRTAASPALLSMLKSQARMLK